MRRGVSLAAVVLCIAPALRAAPVIFWESSGAVPGQAVLVAGSGLGEHPRVEVAALPDGPAGTPVDGGAWPGGGTPAEVLQPSDQGLKFVVPPKLPAGACIYRIVTGGGEAVGRLNRPRLWWAQGDRGGTLRPGGGVTLCGVDLVGRQDRPSTIRLEGPRTLTLTAKGKLGSLTAPLPADLPPGRYRVRLHNGSGGARNWSDAVEAEVAPADTWPATVYNVRELGAVGDGTADDTAAVQGALAKAGAAGGGVVYFPRGRYRLTDALTIPRFTVLRGERRELVNLLWPDFDRPPEALVQGTNSFALEELTLYASQHKHVLAGDLGSKPGAGHVTLRRLRVRADSYRGHLKPEEVDQRFRESMKWSTGGGDTVRLGGDDVCLEDCDLYGSGRSLYLSGARGAVVRNCDLTNGRWGWYCLEGCDRLLFTGNRLSGGDLMSTGGGIANYSTASSRRILYADNDLRLMHGWDREAMTTDAGGGAYFGAIAPVDGATVTLATDPAWGGRDWRGAGLFLLDGTGAGQYRRIASYEGRKVTLEAPFAVPPDGTTVAGITMFHGQYLLVGNRFTDTGALQFYGTSIDCVVAGNEATRTQGFQALGLHYYGFQPSWYCQFLGNVIHEGNYYHWANISDAAVRVTGARHAGYDGPLVRGAVLRGNVVENNGHLAVQGGCDNVLVEGNRVTHAERGVFVSREARGVLVRNNTFEDVAHPVLDEDAARRAAVERLKGFLGRKDPVGAWSFETVTGGAFADGSGNGFAAKLNGGVTLADGVRGKAARFDGTGFLRVDEPAVFNAPDLTVALWVKPDALRGRYGLVSKRFGNTSAPFVLGLMGAAPSFEGTDEDGKWTFNFGARTPLTADWHHVAAVIRDGVGVTLYVDGQPAGELANPKHRVATDEPLILGREAWGGDPPKGDTPGFYHGLMDEVRIWTRALTPDELATEAKR